ncbi:DUF6483 family protein [Paludibacteraceae bacterium OttesenSCG-928-F17]|nr:DUF6483 family protein [Paludibacteraceae bacterium OttesenSCG-928-F17]
MNREDYIMKYIEKLGRVIAAMLFFRRKNAPDSSLGLAEEVYDELLSLNLSDLLEMDEKSFDELIEKQNYHTSYIESLAAMTHEAGKAYELKKDKQNELRAYQKSLQLYKILNTKDKTFSFEREKSFPN